MRVSKMVDKGFGLWVEQVTADRSILPRVCRKLSGKGKGLLLLRIILFEVMQHSWRSDRDVRVGSGEELIDF